jgi:L-fuculose-phosphate aldolase
MEYRLMSEQDVVRVEEWTGTFEGKRKPSTERELHLQIYKVRKDVNAIIHYHSPYATAVAVSRKSIPNILDEGTDITPIPTIRYATSGSSELADNVAAGMAKGRNALLLANHGVVVVGENLTEALNTSLRVERLAKVFVWAEAIGGAVALEEWAVERSRSYLREYKATKAAAQSMVRDVDAEAPSRVLHASDLIQFGFRSWLAFGSLLHSYLAQRFRG